MLGIVIGTLCLLGFIKVAFGRRHRYWGPWGWHGGHGTWRSRWHGHGHGHHAGMYWVLSRLDTSPGQEKAIRTALQELWTNLGQLRPSVKGLRSELAEAFGKDAFHPSDVVAAFTQRQAELGSAQSAIATALHKIHEALDPDQRQRLARMLDSGAAWGV